MNELRAESPASSAGTLEPGAGMLGEVSSVVLLSALSSGL
jgi:hypothetical protein